MDAPWSNKETLRTTNKLERLSKEIVDFEKYIAPTQKEQLNRDTLLYSVSQLIESLWPGNVIAPFGSSVTGLQFPSRLIPHAKVPVLMATDDNNVSMDITVQNESPSSDRTVLWIKEYPLLKTLFMVLKQVLSNYRVSSLPTFEPLSAKTAGLASYSLICMIVSYLQLQAPKSHDPSRPEYIAETLLGFLDFYSRFDSSLYAISLIDGGAYLTADYSPIGIDPKEGKLTIIDPDVPGANVARSTLRFDILKLIFARAHSDLRKRLDSSTKGESILSSVLLVKPHYYGEPRSEGTRFKKEEIWIDTGLPSNANEKRSRFRPHAVTHVAAGKRNEERRNASSRDERRYNPYQSRNKSHNNTREDRYEREDRYQRKDSYRRENYHEKESRYQKEYERHARNNHSHLAEHYKKKADRAKRNHF
ncbi:Non-canonical poly(A) RNA polymerase PAPD5 [Choanephora cucurbitarum]|uniref:Non-canonical poly(A) RNA polymerase PAPD5 n=1 Tax=Choanephora cucurbitarum TaxID=101091 RepID=A0A1C7NGQ2_9FUNG|nr:Non-canonical poly(A) RNA polymerase PAPD5 [Choanephora cucurbitarum]